MIPGDRHYDGTIYVGVSPDNNLPLFAQPHDSEWDLSWEDAGMYAAASVYAGYDDWRLPSQNELKLLHRYRKKIGKFKMRGYWAAAPHYLSQAWVTVFPQGNFVMVHKSDLYEVRCVRAFDECLNIWR